MKLRSQLMLLALAALLPVAVLAAILGAFLIDQQRETFRRGTQDRVRALTTAVDAELNGSIDVLRALANVRSIDEGNLRLFRETAAQILKEQDNWATINLALPDGQQIVNMRIPEGEPLPRIPPSDESVARVVQFLKPAVGDMVFGPTTQRWDFAVRVPVVRHGKLRYILSAVVNPESIGGLLALQRLPRDWEGMVVDRDGRIVARTVEPASVGQYASVGLRNALGESSNGWYRGTNLEGVVKYRAYRRSDASGWAFAMAIPVEAVDATASRAIWMFVLALVAAIAVALTLARLIGRRIAEPITALVAATDRLAHGEQVEIKQSARPGELRTLETALRNAAGAQVALKRAEEQTRSIVDHVVDGIITIDQRGIIESFNRAAERLFGYSASEVIGKNVKLLMPELYRTGHDGYIGNYISTGQAKIIGIGREVSGQRKDGSTFPMDLAVSEFRLGERRFFTGIVRDITERKLADDVLRASEARKTSILKTSLDAILTIDSEGKVLEMNPAAESMFGYAADELLGQNLKMLMPEPYQSEHDGYIANYLRTGQAKIIGIGREVVGRRKDGSTFPMELAVVTYELDKRQFFTGFVRDISREKENEKRVYDLLTELREADRKKDEFLATLAHELRNPLAPLRNMLEVMKRADGSRDLPRQARETMERQLGHLVRLVDDLLDMSRITRNRLELRKERVELASVIDAAVEICRPLVEGATHKITVTLPPEPIYLDADPVRLSQVFSNLLDNACKYTEPGGRVTVIAERRGSDVVVKVTDNGIGIPPDMLGSVFDMFTQVDRSLERSQDGLGIGLTLVKRLVEMHSGTVAAFSEGPSRGSEFVVRLPVLIGNEQIKEPLPTADARVTMARRILVVDDNRDSAQSLDALLKLTGNDTHVAYDGLQAVGAAEQFRPDVALLDIGLPKLNGLEVARRIREQPWGKDMVLVAMTGWGQDNDRHRSKAAGFDHHMAKPVDFNLLMRLLAEAPTTNTSRSPLGCRTVASLTHSGAFQEGKPAP